MACCTGQTECNHIITIGYLKDFTNGLIQNGSGVAQSVNLNALPSSARTDSYCPTYAQLTGGSLIPNFVNAGSHKWSQNVDGITINGSYGSTQCVKQEDLVATYTRFESLTITATPSTNISECGGTSRMSYTYTLRKYVKSMNTACTVSTTSSTDTDTTDSGDAAIVYSANQTWATISKPTVTLAKNGTHDSPARSVTITGRITFRGTQHSTTATIGQKALTGDYKFWYHTYELYSRDSVTVSPDHFDCNGGDWEATGYYTNHDWDVYRWQDSCGVDYNSDTENRNHTYPSYTESYSSGTVSFVDCETLPSDYTHTETVNYYGKTASWTQECPTCSGDCPCGQTCRFDTIHSGGTIPCTGGSVDVKYDYIVKSVTCNPSTGQRTETIVESGANLTWATVYADGCNKTSSPITYEYNVVQEAGPCCPTGDVFSIDDVEIVCQGAAATSKTVKYTQVHTNPDTTTTTTTGTTEKSIPGASCNATSNRKLIQAGNTGTTLAAAQPAVYQAAGPCCPTGDVFTYDDVTIDCYASAATTTSVTYTQVHTNPDTTTTTTTGTNPNTPIPARTCNPDSTTRVIQVGNTGATLAEAKPKVTQAAGPCCCSCDDFGLGSETLSWAWNATATKAKTYTAGTCISDVTASSNNTWFSVNVNGNNINVTPSGQNTTTSAKNATITVSYKADGSSCTSKTFTVSQDPYGCTCDDLTIGTAPSAWAWNVTTTKSVAFTANSVCITNMSVSSDNTWFSASINGSNINVTPSGQNNTTVAKTATITMSYNSDGTPCSKTFNVEQNAYGCTCDDLTIGSAPSAWAWTETAAKSVAFTANSVCITNMSVSSDNTWFSASINGSNISVSPSGQNTTTSAKNATITVSYKTNGTDCSKTFNVSQGSNTCSCDDLTISSTPSNWSWDETSSKTATYTFNSTCITNISVSSNNTWFTVTNNSSTGTITISPSGNNTTTTAKAATITISYNTNGSGCSKTFDVEQNPYGCSCGDLTIDSTPSAWEWDDLSQKTASFSFNNVCITNISINVTGSSSTAFTVTSALTTSSGTITIKPNSTNPSATSSKIATVIINYKSNGTDCSQQFVITQKSQGCSCEDLTITGATSNIASSGGSPVEIANFTVGRGCFETFSGGSEESWITVLPYTSGNKLYASIGANTTCTSRTGTVSFKYGSGGTYTCTTSFTITQDARACTCSDVTFNVTKTALDACGASTKQQIGTYSTNCATCIDLALSTGGTFAGLTVTFENGKIYATYPSTTSDKSGTLILKYDGADCTTINLSQPKCCNCSDLTVTPTALTWSSWDDVEEKQVGFTFDSSCIDNIGVSCNNPWFVISAGTMGPYYTVKPSGNNTTLTAKTGTITIQYNASGRYCSKTVSLNQPAYVCSCQSDFTILTTPAAWEWNETTAKTATYSFNSTCVTASDISVSIAGSSSSHFTVSNNTSTKTITITPNAQNDTSNAISATVVVGYKINGNNCSKTFVITHKSQACTCADLTVTPITNRVPTSGGSGVKIADFTNSRGCFDTFNAVSDSTWLSPYPILSTATTVGASVSPNSTCSARTATITFSYGSGGTYTCSSAFTVTQEPRACSCSDITFNITKTALDPCGATNPQQIGTYTFNCATCSKGALSKVGTFSNLTVTFDDGKIYATYPSATSAKSGTLILRYNGTNCDGATYNLTQDKCCGCSDVTINCPNCT